MSKVRTAVRMALGGAVCGTFPGIFVGGLIGGLAGLLASDGPAGLGGALVGAVVGCVGGACYGLFLAAGGGRDDDPTQPVDVAVLGPDGSNTVAPPLARLAVRETLANDKHGGRAANPAPNLPEVQHGVDERTAGGGSPDATGRRAAHRCR